MKHRQGADVVSNLARNVQRIMQERGMSQRALARDARQPVMTINTLVKGTHTPGVDVVSAVADALQVTVDELLRSPRKKIRKAS